MKKELQEKLFEKYPKIFQDKDKTIQESLIPEGICCGDGWYSLIDQLCYFLQFDVDKNSGQQIVAFQVKEKFGGLRFYIKKGSDKQYGTIHFAEFLSYKVCEKCGSTKDVKQTKERYIQSLCLECIEKKKGKINMFFGKKLKELRLNKANMGCHKFAEVIDMLPLDLNHIEYGYIEYPRDKEWLFKIQDAFKFDDIDSDCTELAKLWSEPFVMQKMDEDIFPGPFTSKADGTQLTIEELKKLCLFLQNHAKEHNKKAKEYNKKHNGT